jgi:putative membrane protein
MKSGSITVLALGAILFLVASPGLAQQKSEKEFLADATQGDIAEIEVGQLAETLGTSDGVRNYGRMLAMDHGKGKDEATKVAQSLRIVVPATAKPEAQTEYDKLSKLSGTAFDVEFLRAMVQDHQKTISEFEVQAKHGSGPTAKLATAQLATLRNHLAAAQTLQKKSTAP